MTTRICAEDKKRIERLEVETLSALLQEYISEKLLKELSMFIQCYISKHCSFQEDVLSNKK